MKQKLLINICCSILFCSTLLNCSTRVHKSKYIHIVGKQIGADIGQKVIIHYFLGPEIGTVVGTKINNEGDKVWLVKLEDGVIEEIWSFDGWGTTLLDKNDNPIKK